MHFATVHQLYPVGIALIPLGGNDAGRPKALPDAGPNPSSYIEAELVSDHASFESLCQLLPAALHISADEDDPVLSDFFLAPRPSKSLVPEHVDALYNILPLSPFD